jgi:hypothetical protein
MNAVAAFEFDEGDRQRRIFNPTSMCSNMIYDTVPRPKD